MKKEMLINVLQPEECRIAIVEDGVLEELYVERTSLESYTGNIYKGKIVNLEPAIQAAFVDFSVGRNGFLHVSDVEPQYYLRHVAHEAEFGARDKDRDPRRDRDRRPDRDPRRERPAVEGRERPVEDREGDLPPPPPRGEERYRDRPDRSERGRRDRSVEPRRFGEGLTDDEYPPSPPPLPPAPPRSHVPAPEPPRPEPERFPREEPRRAPKAEPTPSFWGDEPRVVEREGPPAEFEEPRARLPRTAEPFDFETQLPPSRTQRARTQPPRPADLESVDVDRPAATPEPGLSEPEPEPPAARERGRGRGREREPRRGRRGSRPLPEPEVMFPEEPAAGLSAEIEAPLVEPEIEALAEPPEEFRPEARPRGRAAIRSRGGEREIEPARPRALPPERPVVEPEIERDRDRPRDRPRGFEPEAPRDRPRAFEPEAPRDRPRGIEPEAPRDRDRPRGFEPEPPRERDREREPKPERTKPHDRAGEPGYVPRRERSRGSEPGFGAGIEGAGALGGSDLTGELKAEGELEAGIEPGGEEGTSAAGRLDGPRRRRRRRGRRRERGDREPLEAGAAAELEGEGEEFEEGEEEGTEIEAPVERAPARPRERQRPPRREEIVEVEDEEHDDLGDEFDFGDEGAAIAEEEEEGIEERAAVSVDEEIDPELEEEIRREIEEIAELEREMGLRGPVEARPRRGDEREPEAGGRPGGRLPRGRGMTKPPIQEIFRRGDEVLIQVIKESIGTKGPTLSTYISIPGRYLVLMPGLNRVGVSRKIADEGQRRKLREIMTDLNPPKGLGFIVRTAGLERTKRELARDLAYLLRLWKVILRRIKKTRAPAPIYQESDMITRTIRDIFTSEIDTIWIDEPQAFERAQEFLRVVMPRFVDRLKLYSEKVPLFHKYGIEDEIAKIQRRHVPLPEGGSIVIDQTEALVAIDVNSGNFRVENDAEKTAYEMNLRAAKEIARQLRLRDLGGVIVNDFIDMREERHRRGVERALRDAIKRDRARTKILRMSAFGLIEMTRQRIRPSLKRSVYEDCAHCAGAGVLKTVESMSIDVVRLLALASHRTDIRRVNISVAPSVAAYLNNRKRHDITRIEAEANMSIFIKAEEDAAGEHLQIDCFDGSNNEIRLLPAPVATNRRGHTRD